MDEACKTSFGGGVGGETLAERPEAVEKLGRRSSIEQNFRWRLRRWECLLMVSTIACGVGVALLLRLAIDESKSVYYDRSTMAFAESGARTLKTLWDRDIVAMKEYAGLVFKNGTLDESAFDQVSRLVFSNLLGPSLVFVGVRVLHEERLAFEAMMGKTIKELDEKGAFILRRNASSYYPVLRTARDDGVVIANGLFDANFADQMEDILQSQDEFPYGKMRERRILKRHDVLGKYSVGSDVLFHSGDKIFSFSMSYSFQRAFIQTVNNWIEPGMSYFLFDATESENNPLYLHSNTADNSEEEDLQTIIGSPLCQRSAKSLIPMYSRTWLLVCCTNDGFRVGYDVSEILIVVFIPIFVVMFVAIILLRHRFQVARADMVNKHRHETQRLEYELLLKQGQLGAEIWTRAYLSHELRTPVHILRSLFEELCSDPVLQLVTRLRHDKDGDAEEENIVESIDQTIDDLLQILDRGLLPSKAMISRHFIGDIVRDVLNQFSCNHRFQDKLKLQFGVMDPELAAQPQMLDVVKVRQILCNGLDNACRYVPNGTVTIDTRLEDGAITVSIVDTGPGLTKPITFKHDQDTTLNGTQVAYSLAKSMGGSLTVTKKEDHGTGCVFKLSIPYVAAAAVKEGQGNPDEEGDEPPSNEHYHNNSNLYRNVAPSLVIQVGTEWTPMQTHVVANVASKLNINVHHCATIEIATEKIASNQGTRILVLTKHGTADYSSIIDTLHACDGFQRNQVFLLSVDPHGSTFMDSYPTMTNQTLTSTLHSAMLSIGEHVKFFEDSRGGDITAATTTTTIKNSLNDVHIACCEDDPLCAKLLMRTLKKFTPNVIIFEDGLDLLGYVRKLKLEGKPLPDILLLDIVMKRSMGDEIARQIIADGFNLPLVAVTGNSAPSEVQNLFQSGFTDIVIKPYPPMQLRNTIAKVLNLL